MIRTTLAASGLALMLTGGIAMADPSATIATGTMTGLTENGIDRFLGIPYAAPPVGDLRWRAPQDPAAWDGTFAATSYGNDCAQLPFPSDAAPLGADPSEDCLYVNVWRPEGTTDADALPVMVWIHGGGFINGGASPAVYDGANLAREGMVVVSLNYRLARFGFFAHPALSDEGNPDEVGGNYGVLDQAKALHWVHDNIAALGGDPDHVTVVGESAGGQSVHFMLTSPKTQGLVQAAVIQSGGDGGPAMAFPFDQAQAAAITFAEAKGITGTGAEAAAALRALPTDDIIDGLNLAALFVPDPNLVEDYHLPVQDDVVVVDIPAAYASGAYAGTPVMIGATSDDLGGPDGMMLRGASDLAGLMTDNGMPTYHYVYDYVAESERSEDTRGAPHAGEIPFFFGTFDARYPGAVTVKDRSASATALSYLANFVKTGNPNIEGEPDWPMFSEDRATLTFTPDGSAAVTTE